ncbi:MAG: hypothetical protein ACKV2T_42800 [Kofleriaceae bacterium]
MDRSMELRLPTIAVPVRLAMIGASPVDAALFVPDIPRSSRGTLIDDLAALLDEPAAWLPARLGGEVRLVGKRAVAWISLTRRDPERAADDFSSEEPSEVMKLYDQQFPVEVELVNGTRLRGTLLDSAPADRSRVIDHLNAARGYVRLWTCDEQYFISTAQISAVTPLPESAV